MKYSTLLLSCFLLIFASCSDDGGQKNQEWKMDRTKLPIAPPPIEKFTELDARNTKQPESFDVRAPEGASVGWDDSSPVSKNYKAGKSNAFNGKIDHVKISLQK
jgi:hypothetical protein